MLKTAALLVLLLLAEFGSSEKAARARSRQALKLAKNRTRFRPHDTVEDPAAGLWPKVFNVAAKAVIAANATCGERGREEYCRMSEKYARKCEICDGLGEHAKKQRHPIQNAIDGTVDWWQSPAIYYGAEFEYVTITLDLKQVYQVTHVTIKSAISPRPGSWVLERSLDGDAYSPWQYYARSDRECLERYGVAAKKGRPHYDTDTEVICTSYYSKPTPLENGEIHTLMQDRPGASERSPELLEFTKARFVRVRLQGLKRPHEMMTRRLGYDHQWHKRLFYSIRDIQVGGQCVCNGHAADCRHDVSTGKIECLCAHNTCGPNCNKCCPLYNQRKWSPGTTRDARECLPCNCNGHADSCHYDENVDAANGSLDVNGNWNGGGVCDNCTAFTAGINCERCLPGRYRPAGVAPDAAEPCRECDCDPAGSAGLCAADGDRALCECRAGFAGPRCDACAPGRRGYPLCEPCPCDPRGTLGADDCEDECACKANVEGPFCERCKSGYFSLQDRNPDGCSRCYCSGVTTLCSPAVLSSRTFRAVENWSVADVSLTNVEKAMAEEGLSTIATFENSASDAYWLAPKEFLGNMLIAYGSEFVFKTQWIVMRGDTSGKPTIGPDMILIGTNGLIIAYGNDVYHGSNATFHIPLTESNWTKITITENEITPHNTSISRSDFLSVLIDLKHILLRANFHTDQNGVALEDAFLEIPEGLSSVEECSCPSGYTGLSCEFCDYGYVQLITNSSHHQEKFCLKCDCNGHSKTCDPDTGQCLCEHNTTGETCDRCLPGYYGNPLLGTPEDCRKCACPLEEEENNFSPSCQLDTFSATNDYGDLGYVCTQCPKGYTGDHCEICDDGYFGLPTRPGGNCQLCSCGGNPCDRTTGKCLACRGNTEGWRCERCKAGYFGNASTANCEACSCDAVGSASEECDNVTGHCRCKENFVGRTCDRCKEGYGNVTALCVGCDCDPTGSTSSVCDQRTGLCYCKPGVEGFHCDACQHLHYNFSSTGCQRCNCNPKGSEFETCDIKDGKCRCKPHYTGRACDGCEDGYWNAAVQCTSCNCNDQGSNSIKCDQRTGQCGCKPGVTGIKCEKCLPNYYAFSNLGCKKCEDCSGRPGYTCHPLTGRCVCPPLSQGPHCNKCEPNAWGYEPNIGCKDCGCSKSGSKKLQCNLETGDCSCRAEYEGEKCDKCKHGYYGYPNCKRCDCNFDGTNGTLGRCDINSICQCDDHGNCPCKRNVSGKKCTMCKEGHFGLHKSNPEGCMECFCFGRSTNCTNAPYTWGQNRTISTRVLTYGDIPSKNDVIESDYISGDYDNYTISDMEMIPWMSRMKPLYWRLPPMMQGDKTLSYNGYLQFSVNSFPPSYNVDDQYPLVKLIGNDLELHYYPRTPMNRHEIKLHEDEWKIIHPKGKYAKPKQVNKTAFMIVLQNVTEILIKATDPVSNTFTNLTLSEMVMDTAMEISGNPPPKAMGIEMCTCPPQYTGLSCQNPNSGYYRLRDLHSGPINKSIGRAEPCQCNSRSNTCDIETGKCSDCQNNTSGFYCENCAEGYYGDPLKGGSCRACPCPSAERNFAIGCKPLQHRFYCECKRGHTGAECEKCSEHYYRDPNFPESECVPCNCNPYSSYGRCDHQGQCDCKKGFTGRQCSQCEKTRHIVIGDDCIPCDECTQILLDRLDDLSLWVHGNTSFLLNGTIHPPWGKLSGFNDRYLMLEKQFDDYEKFTLDAKNLFDGPKTKSLEKEINNLNNKYRKTHSALTNTTREAIAMQKETDENVEEMNKIINEINITTSVLENFGKGRVNTKEALAEAKNHLENIRTYQEIIQKDNKNIYDKCHALQETVKKIHKDDVPGKTMVLKSDLRKIKEFLVKTDDHIKGIEGMVTEIVQRNVMNEQTIEDLKSKLEELNANLKRLENDVTSANKILNQTAGVLGETEDILENLEEGDLRNAMVDLDRRSNELDDEIQVLNKFIDLGRNHARDLNLNVSHIERVLELTDKEVNAVQASEAYSKIVDNLKEATRTATDARDDLHELLKRINGTDRDTLPQIAAMSLASSTRLESRIVALQPNQEEIDDKLATLKSRLDKMKGKIWDNGILNIKHSKEIWVLKKQSNVTDLLEDMNNAGRLSDDMKRVYTEASDIESKMQYELEKLYGKRVNLTSPEELRKMTSQVAEAKKEVQTLLNEKLVNFKGVKPNEKVSENFLLANKTLSQRLDELKKKIQKSRELADGIRVSMSGPECQRTYQLKNLRPSLITDIVIRLQKHSSSNNTQASVFYLAANNNDYISIDINNLNVEFSTRIGGQEIKKSLPIIEGDNKIIFQRHTNKGKLQVNDQEELLSFKMKTSKIFNVTASNLIYVGGFKKKIGLSDICLDDIIVNNMKIGLWEFMQITEETSPCLGCVRSQEKIPPNSAHSRFNGEGYSLIKPDNKTNINKFSVTTSLRTFDENALLFLSIYPSEHSSYLAISLNDGHIQYETHYGTGKNVSGITEEKYNNGKLVQITLRKEYKGSSLEDMSVMIVEPEEMWNETKVGTIKIGKDHRLKLRKSNFYVGGLPPDFNFQCPNCGDAYLLTRQSLLGDVVSFKTNIEHQVYETSNTQKQYGVELTLSPLEFTMAWFEGSGYLLLKPQNLKEAFSISFVLRTEQQNTQNATIMHIENALTILLNNGGIVVRLNDDSEISIPHKINNDEYHIVEFTRQNNVDTLQIGDKKEMKQYKTTMKIPGNIYLGGKPDDGRKFNGEIRDIIIDDALIKFKSDTIKEFEKVKIGRSKPQKKSRMEVKLRTSKNVMKMRDVAENMKDMQSTEGCNKVNYNYTLEPNAAKFGDVQESYVTYHLKESFWKNEYSIEIEFRTFHKNGLLLFAQGEGKHYYLLELKDNLILLHASGKRKKTIRINKIVDDGKWHKVLIERRFEQKKKRKKVHITVDGVLNKPQKLPQNKVFGELYVGDIPKTIQHKVRKQTMMKILPFRGCIKPLRINHNLKSFDEHHHIGQCFPNVEKGSYFRGDSYALYNKNFKFANDLEINLEFRTTEQNGILLSVSSPTNSPAVSLELYNGAVVLSVDMGDNSITNVTNSLSEYSLCNNRWHNLTALISTELTVIVDGVSKSWVISDVGPKEEIEGIMYIGGIPDFAPEGTLKVRDNFKGCMRNLKIDENHIDWIKMDELNHISLNSCPVI